MPNLPALFQAVASFAYTIILLLVPILIKLLYPQVKAWIDAKVASAKSNMSVDQLYALQNAASVAVAAVEQLKKNGVILDNAHAFETASTIVENWLRSRGIVLDITQLRAVIEAAVNDLPHSASAVRVPEQSH